ncbi:hypothetical protein POTOM_017099 [Populus tomentosa]|uniref:non-specific serine/threonine protein kinase n=1 Tax=Populus tomentosa TaxID=118781 RepID=A0A8X7ZZN3_POPTO|nr:hypothetical protein POTOM_017099 [Populus tomentosa]
MAYNTSSVNNKISKHASYFGIRLWILILALIVVLTVLFLVISSLLGSSISVAENRNLSISPLTWAIRMKIIRGIAKGLAYLPEDIEPKIIHQNLKSSNILLDHQWNPKINDFGITNNSLNGNIWVSFFESACLTHRNLALVTLWNTCHEDHIYATFQGTKTNAFARSSLCVDRDIKQRPAMGDVIHMLEPRDLLLDDDRRKRRDGSSRRKTQQESHTVAKFGEGDFSTHEKERKKD